MRIDAYNQIAQVYKTTSAAKLQKTENARHGRDEVQISSFGRFCGKIIGKVQHIINVKVRMNFG